LKTIELSKARLSLAEYAEAVKREPVVVTRDGKPVAALVGLGGADMETVSLSTDRGFIELIERSRIREKKEGGITSDEMRKRLKIPGKNKHRIQQHER